LYPFLVISHLERKKRLLTCDLGLLYAVKMKMTKSNIIVVIVVVVVMIEEVTFGFREKAGNYTSHFQY